jgi:very-short-patch-repair endonuclease
MDPHREARPVPARVPDADDFGTATPPPTVLFRSVPGAGTDRNSFVVPVLDVREIAVGGTFEQRVSAVATEQRGRVSRTQLLGAGLSGTTIARLQRRGYMHAEHAGVYVVGHLAEIPGGREASALLAARSGAVLSHRSAAGWWGIATSELGRGDASADGEVHVTAPGNHGGRPSGVVVHRSTILAPRDLRVHDGLPVTSPARTLLDLAGELAPRELERMLDTALVQGRVNLRQINELLRRAGRHAGCAAIRGLLEAHTHTTFTRSEAEERFLAIVREAGLPDPLVNVRRHGFELDFLWPREPGRDVAVEIDGYAFHGGRAAFERDRRRDAILRAAGIDVLRFTWRRLTQESHAVVAELAAALAPLVT